jgi:uncharacterized membrane protein YvbJ
MFCKYCGHALANNAMICPNCGKMISQSQRNQMQIKEQQYLDLLHKAQDENYKYKDDNSSHINNRKTLIYILGIILIIILIALIIFINR